MSTMWEISSKLVLESTTNFMSTSICSDVFIFLNVGTIINMKKNGFNYFYILVPYEVFESCEFCFFNRMQYLILPQLAIFP